MGSDDTIIMTDEDKRRVLHDEDADDSNAENEATEDNNED